MRVLISSSNSDSMAPLIQSKLSDRQKKKYQEEFNALIKLTGESIQKLWTEGGVEWEGDTPHYINNIHLKLRGKSFGRYMELNRRLAGGTI